MEQLIILSDKNLKNNVLDDYTKIIYNNININQHEIFLSDD